jgi:hypothetical protein
MAGKKIYDVRWEDLDGEQGYYVKMTKAEAEKVRRFLDAAAVAAPAETLKNVKVDAIEGDWLLTPKQLIKEFKDRYSNS